ncbi:hypothetical protein F4X86_01525 [Candidatus Saccharibacteria bacterium]|nr:hypothetical protein [Candidatus Saccharibacteria bacterium]
MNASRLEGEPSRRQVYADAQERAFGGLFESLDPESRMDLDLELGLALGNTLSSDSGAGALPEERRYERVLGVLAGKISLTAGEIRDRLGGTEHEPFDSVELAFAPELGAMHEIDGPEQLEPVLHALIDEVGLITRADILPGYIPARSPLAAERHHSVELDESRRPGLGQQRALLPIMKFDADTGELFIWGEDRGYGRNDHLSQRLVFFEDDGAGLKEGLAVAYNADPYYQRGSYAGREPLPLTVALYRSASYPGYDLAKTIRAVFDSYGGVHKTTEFEADLQIPIPGGLVRRRYTALVDRRYRGSFVTNRTFRFQRFGEEAGAEESRPPIGAPAIERIMHSVRLSYGQRHPLLPLEDVRIEQDCELMRLRVERREEGNGSAEPCLQVDKEYRHPVQDMPKLILRC